MDLRTRQGRNNFYNTTEWTDLREYKLHEDPFCEHCRRKDKLIPAVEVHHRIDITDAPELALIFSNLESLCHHCHSSHTAKETFRKLKEKQIKPHYSFPQINIIILPKP